MFLMVAENIVGPFVTVVACEGSVRGNPTYPNLSKYTYCLLPSAVTPDSLAQTADQRYDGQNTTMTETGLRL